MAGPDEPTRPDELLMIGRVAKAHGLKGEIVVHLTTNRTERLDSGSTLFTDERTLVVATARPKGKDFIVKFERFEGREAVEPLQGCTLYAPPMDDPDELWIHELIGATVVDGDGIDRGVVVAVEANPASDLLVLETGALVPARFVTEFADRQVVVDAPTGLFDL